MNSNSRLALQQKINDLKKSKNAVILAHYYQEPDIQDVADYVGDSLGLSQKAAQTNADIIVFAGVHFMAETAKILNPSKKVILPDLNAGCSLADSCTAAEFKKFADSYPNHLRITYINCSAEIKAMSDIICTSANAVQIVNSVPPGTPILFAPDKNLGHYVSLITGRKMLLWDGACEVHEAFSMEKIKVLMRTYPGAKLVVHPESNDPLIALADHVGSTSSMIGYIKNEEAQQFIVATEAGILHQLKKEAGDKLLIPAPAMENNSCACSECRFMKMNTLQKLHDCLLNESPEINVPEDTRLKALVPLERMLEISIPKKKASIENN
jgi:quinolinate synthase